MNTWVRRSLSAGALTAGAVMAAGTAAHADTTMTSQDNFGILNGTQVFAPIQAPINLCGVAAALGGQAFAGCQGGSAASISGLYDVTMISQDNAGILNGTQVFAPIQVPVDVCGVAAAVLGQAFAGCEGGASATLGQSAQHREGRPGRHHTESESIPQGCGTTCPPPAQPAPPAQENPQPPAGENPGHCQPGDDDDHHGGKGRPGRHSRQDNDGVKMISTGNAGILNGTQLYAPIQAPIEVSGVAVSLIGQASAWSLGGSSALG